MGYYNCYLCSVLPLLLLLAFSWSVHAWQLPIMGYEAEDVVSEERLLKLFEKWRDTHRKSYQSREEEDKRLQIFKRNLEYIDGHNRKKSSSKRSEGHWLGLNKFADLTNEEFKGLYSGRLKQTTGSVYKQPLQVNDTYCEAHGYLDWRRKGAVTPVQDQGTCDSDWAFSVTGAIEGINAISTGVLVSLSKQELIDCDSTNHGCKGGYMDSAFEWTIQNGGIDHDTDYPYTAVDNDFCIARKTKIKAATVDGYSYVQANDSALLCAVTKQPVSAGISGTAIDFQFYMGGIYNGDCSENPDDIDHAVLIVGYSSEDEEDYWIVKNSWGTDWGLKGYIYIRRNTERKNGVCAINAMALYPTKKESPAVSPQPPLRPLFVSCNSYSYCSLDQTCCACTFRVFGYCLLYGCCDLPNAVCCEDSRYYCPEDYPVCDTTDGMCLKNAGDDAGVRRKKRKAAQYKMPWRNPEIVVTPPTPRPYTPVPTQTPRPPPPSNNDKEKIVPPPSNNDKEEIVPPPPPPRSRCSQNSYCFSNQTCCCEVSGSSVDEVCCCDLLNAVCCKDSMYCCPQDYPICDSGIDFTCIKNVGDTEGVPKKKRKPISASTHSSTGVTELQAGPPDHDSSEL